VVVIKWDSVREGYVALIQLNVLMLCAGSWWIWLCMWAVEKWEVTSHFSPYLTDRQGNVFLRCKPYNLVPGYLCWWGTFCVKSYWTMYMSFNYQSCGKCMNTRNVHIHAHKFWSIFNWLMVVLILYQVHVTCFAISIFSLRSVSLVAFRRIRVSGDSVYLYKCILP
jgi:hypothetical protein